MKKRINKRNVYILSTMILLLVTTFFLYELSEIAYVYSAPETVYIIRNMHIIRGFWFVMTIGSGVLGYLLGQKRWKIVYERKGNTFL